MTDIDQHKAAFLAKGGKVQEIADGVTAEAFKGYGELSKRHKTEAGKGLAVPKKRVRELVSKADK